MTKAQKAKQSIMGKGKNLGTLSSVTRLFVRTSSLRS